jgi:VWFA-related protein
MRPLLAVLLATAGLVISVSAQDTTPEPTGIQFKSGANEIVLDLVVTDKKGRPLLDVKKEEVSLTDNGVKQEVRGFRLVDLAAAPGTPGSTTARQPQLVTLVFEAAMEVDARRQAKLATQELLKSAPANGMYIGIVGINQQLCLLQPFTTDREALKTAIDLATNGQPTHWIEHSTRMKADLTSALNTGSAEEKKLRQVMLAMLRSTDIIVESPRATIFGLLSLVRGQSSFPGRKGIVYISWGMWRPPHMDEPFRNLVSSANRANVSFYPVSALGVATWSQNSMAAQQMQAAAILSADAITRDDGRFSAATMAAGDLAETAGRNNIQQAMKELADGTGGEYFGDTNDFKKPMRAAVTELSSYYEVTYDPGIQNYDGAFRKTEVSVNRADAQVRSRTGYYALPVAPSGEPILSYELPMFKALDGTRLPRDITYQAAAVRFQPTETGTETAILVDVPMSSITFTEDPQQSRYRSRLSLIALVKNAQGETVQRFSHDLPLIGPLDKMAIAKAGRFLYKERVILPTGRYLFETVVLDHGSNKVGAKRVALVVPPPAKGVQLSHISIVRRFEPAVKGLDPAESFQFQGGRVTPTLTGNVYAVKGATLSLFFVVYPEKNIPAKPEGIIEYLRDGAVVAKAAIPLPESDAKGRIPYVMSSPADAMPPGSYEVRIAVKQGDSMTEERAFVTVEPAPTP